MDQRKQRVRLGLFVAAAIVLLGGMILLFGGAPQRLFVSRHPYTIVFTDAPGISVGTPVRRSGVRIGEVSGVELDDQTGEVRVQILVVKKYSIRKNEEAVISQDLLSRDTTIDFVPIVAPSPPPVLKAPEGEPTLKPPEPTLKPPEPILKPPEPLPNKGDPLKPVSFFEEVDNPPAPLGEPIVPGSVIRGRAPTDVRGIISQANEIVPTLQQSLNSIRRSAERFEQTIPLLELAIREFTQVGRAIREAVPELRRTNDEIRTLVQNARNIAPALRRTNEELQVALRNFGQVGETVNVLVQANQDKFVKALDQSTDVLQRISLLLSDENQRNVTATLRATQAASANFDNVLRNADELLRNANQASKPFAERSERILRNLDMSLDQFAKTMTSFGETLATGNGQGTAQRFLNDPSLYNNLNEAACMITRMVPRFDRILRDFEVFADKIARHPESVGIGGAVRPSAGLKESPTVGPPQPYKQRP